MSTHNICFCEKIKNMWIPPLICSYVRFQLKLFFPQQKEEYWQAAHGASQQCTDIFPFSMETYGSCLNHLSKLILTRSLYIFMNKKETSFLFLKAIIVIALLMLGRSVWWYISDNFLQFSSNACGYSLEIPWRGTSNEDPRFIQRKTKIFYRIITKYSFNKSSNGLQTNNCILTSAYNKMLIF